MTAELALGLPLLLAVTVAMVWLLAVAAAQVQVVDAAREAARSAARGDADPVARGAEVAPPHSLVTVTRASGEVRATVTASVSGPGGLLAHLPGPQLRATAVAVDESALDALG